MSIVWSALMPHPPILVPEVGGARAALAQKSMDACRLLAQDFIQSRSELLILISPHSPRPRKGLAYFSDPWLKGNFAKFGSPNCQVQLPNAAAWIDDFTGGWSEALSPLNGEPLDHGALVPLYFLCQAGWTGPTAVLGLPWDDGPILERLGDHIATSSLPRKAGVLASGDMSHCLKSDGPYGFHPSGPKFDTWFVDALSAGSFPDEHRFPATTLAEAKQDALESSRVAWHCLAKSQRKPQLLSYEAPFGVGYCVAKFGGLAA